VSELLQYIGTPYGAWSIYRKYTARASTAEMAKGPYAPKTWAEAVITSIVDEDGKKWVFDAFLRIQHTQMLRITQHPIQNAASISDHAYMLPATVVMEIGMSDAMAAYAPAEYADAYGKFDIVYTPTVQPTPATQTIGGFKIPNPLATSNFPKYPQATGPAQRSEKSVQAYQKLLEWMKDRQKLTIETRIDTYANMVLESLVTPDDVQTFNGLRCTATFKQIIMAEVALKEKKSKNDQITKSNDIGTKTVTPYWRT